MKEIKVYNTLFYAEKEFYGKEKYKEIAEDKGSSFSESDKYLEIEKESYLEYVFDHEYMKDENTKLVYYKLKHSYEDRLKMKLQDESKELSEQEIKRLVSGYSVYEEEGKEYRWDREMLTVFKIGDKFYAVSWRQGLTENQENWYDNQPYEVVM